MNTRSIRSLVTIFSLALAPLSLAQAGQNISSLDTGAGQYAANTGAQLIDPNWSVTLLSSTGIPPGGIPNGDAYLVPNNIGFPFGYWVDNDTTSSWVSYSYPLQTGGDLTGGWYQYQVTFTAQASGQAGVRWLSDNDDDLYVNGVLLGSNSGTFAAWNSPVNFSLVSGHSYTVDLDVYNLPQSYGNPTGARVEFSGDEGVEVSGPEAVQFRSVPDAPSRGVALVLLVLPFVAAGSRRRRQIA
ncbi:MAG TPA: hypothetical protein VGL42_13340 [Opitutaceae bacterium]|jgi:hypothetical protein